jgi:hypothetical protein
MKFGRRNFQPVGSIGNGLKGTKGLNGGIKAQNSFVIIPTTPQGAVVFNGKSGHCS